ncbi:hypothetical protein IW261DRAFT_1425525 [Armillaria novae-zelandiae]|uniref:Uncharacterized protein n=1 Tax=Armillaria novae-zelandiae TaxID=153914 RepID=A0AA39NSJ7_9AGAR|nr:hypothetical protein IW261DRAFT_1425525 [Armillaria novae-zelandiae]
MPGGNPNKRQKTSEDQNRLNNPPPPEDNDSRERGRKTNLDHSHPMPFKFPDPRATANLPMATDHFPYNKFMRSGEEPTTLPAGSAVPYMDATFPCIFIPWNHITVGFPEEIRKAITASPEKFIAAVPFGAGPKFYTENHRADLLLKTFLDTLDFPEKGKLTDFGKFLLWNQCFTTASHSVWNLIPFNLKELAWTITAFQGNIVSNDLDLIAKALACIKAATWRDTSIQNLVKCITQSQGCSGNPAELTVMMTHSWRLSYIETRNFNDNKGPVFLLTGQPITDNLDMHRAIAAHIRRLRIRVNYQQLINVDKIIRCDWCKNQNHPSHACPFLEVDSTWYGLSTDKLRLPC